MLLRLPLCLPLAIVYLSPRQYVAAIIFDAAFAAGFAPCMLLSPLMIRRYFAPYAIRRHFAAAAAADAVTDFRLMIFAATPFFFFRRSFHAYAATPAPSPDAADDISMPYAAAISMMLLFTRHRFRR